MLQKALAATAYPYTATITQHLTDPCEIRVLFEALRWVRIPEINDVTWEDDEIHLTEDTGDVLVLWGISSTGIHKLDVFYP